MKHYIQSLLLLVALSAPTQAQTCYGGFCYPQQPSAPARLVLPIHAQSPVTNHQSPFPHDAHCRISVGDGTTGSGTLVSKNDETAFILTCSHLFDTATSNIVVTFPSGDRYGARLLDRDRAHDLAALLIRVPSASPLAVDETDPVGVLIACGYGGDGRFQPVRGAITGAAQAIGATFPSLKIGGAVRPGDSGGGVLNTAGQLVGVVWGCRDGETYVTCGQPLRNFLSRIFPRGERASARGDSTIGLNAPTLDPETWRANIESRLTALDAKKQDRGDYLQPGDLNNYIPREEVSKAISSETQQLEQTTATRIDSLRTTILDRIEQRINTTTPGLLSGLSTGKLLAGALGLSGPVALAVMAAGALAGRRLKQRTSEAPSSMPPAPRSTPIAIDTPPPPQQTVPESHYVPVQRDDFARAHQWAREQVARKYPGATDVLSTLESLIKQQLAGTPHV
jgi:hypothetical protein